MADVPFVATGDWVILMVTPVGTLLALSEGALPKKGSETKSQGNCSLFHGNGSQHIMVIKPYAENEPRCNSIIDLEDFAGPQVMLQTPRGPSLQSSY
jgi:hypothetical protein